MMKNNFYFTLQQHHEENEANDVKPTINKDGTATVDPVTNTDQVDGTNGKLYYMLEFLFSNKRAVSYTHLTLPTKA